MPRDRDINSRDRSIRNIPVPSSHRRPAARQYEEEEEIFDDTPPSRRNAPPPRLKLPRRRNTLWVWGILIIAVCAVGGLLLSTFFEGATVTITPKSTTIAESQTLLVAPGGPTGTFTYQTLTATQSASTSVAANGTQHVSRAATGVVIIYNTYSIASQPLAAATRIATADGKIYHLKDATTVPGAKKKADGTLAPSSVMVPIYADKPGPAYNIDSTVQMSVVGFKGTPRYTKFVVESQGPISGGFIGDEPAIAAADLANAQNELKRQLDQSIRSVATSQVPDGFVEVNGSLGISYGDIAETSAPNNTVSLTQSVTATLVIVRSADLAVALAKQAAPDYHGEPIALASIADLDLSLGQNSSSTGPLNLLVKGSPTLVWQLDTNALQQALLGKPKSQFQTIVSTFNPAVSKAQASIRPLWKANFPTDPKKLTIIVTK